ncbi:MAG: DUF86 domain-containing protein [Anaerolineae bacterium]|jgi:uncharacterized protein with HEPN domain
MTRAVVLYLRDILQQMNDALEFVQGMTYEQFLQDKKTINAVLRSLEVMGEAAKNVPERIRTQYPDIPWRERAGMRDKVIHFYFGVDPEIVWSVVKERIPEIRPRLERVLHDLTGGNAE